MPFRSTTANSCLCPLNGNGAEIGAHTNRLDRSAEIVPLTLRSHALVSVQIPRTRSASEVSTSRRCRNMKLIFSFIGNYSVIYIDDLAKLLERHGIKAKLFADDVKVYVEIDDL